MKKALSILLTVVLVLSGAYQAYAAQNENSHDALDSVVATDCSVVMDRGTGYPYQSLNLESNVTYNSSCEYYYSVFTNCYFSNHGGSIQISLNNSNDIPDDYGAYMQVKLWMRDYNPGIPEINYYLIDTRYVGVNDSDVLVFSSLNTNYEYFFQFAQSFHTYPTTTAFTITRGN